MVAVPYHTALNKEHMLPRRQSCSECFQVTPVLLKHVMTTTMPLDNNLNEINHTNAAFTIT